MQACEYPPSHRKQLLIGEERRLKSMTEVDTPWEVIGWFLSFYEGDRWQKHSKGLVERRYILVERKDPRWGRATLKGRLRPLNKQ